MRLLLWLSVLLGEKATLVDCAIYVNAMFQEYIFPSVNYFDVKETKWPYFDQVLSGRVVVLPSLNLDVIFPENDDENATKDHRVPFNDIDDDWELERWKEAPKFLIVDFGSASFDTAMYNTSLAASKVGADFVVLIVGTSATWQQKFSFWWSHRFPGSSTEQLAPGGNATHPHFYMAVGAWEGREIIELVEREIRYLGNYSSEEFFFGIDDFDDFRGQDIVLRLLGYMVFVLAVSKWVRNNDHSNGNNRSSGNNQSTDIRYTGEDLGLGEIQSSSAGQDCPVCLEAMQPGETVRILPCRHVLHHDCINGWFEHGKYSCPLCKMDLIDHLEEQRSATYEIIRGSTVRRRRLLWPFERRIMNLEVEDHLIASGSTSGGYNSGGDELGDLELTIDTRPIT